MDRIYSNGPLKDFVRKPFDRLVAGSCRLHLAAPYFTLADPVLAAVRIGKSVQLLVGLNVATSPQALRQVHEVPNLAVRYLTSRFHAKIYIFDDAALLGSSNLTDGGLISNREAVICLDRPDDLEAVEEIRALFFDLWESAQVLTTEKLGAFERAHEKAMRSAPDPDADIERAVGRAEPVNINVASRAKSRERIFLEELRQQVYEQYRPAFSEVTGILVENGFRRPELADVGEANETNRFLNWVRLTYVIGDEAWQSAPLRASEDRRREIERLGSEWQHTPKNRVPENYADWVERVRALFGTAASIKAASKEELTQALMSLHAFVEQLRFVKGGESKLPGEFWKANNDDVERVKDTLAYLVHGPDDFIKRLHDILYDPKMKLGRFGRFCALELYGTIKPEQCPPMNGRMAKALRYLGYDVRGT